VHVRVQDTLKLLGQLGPIDWAGVRRNPFKLYAGITPAVIETAAYKWGALKPEATDWLRRPRTLSFCCHDSPATDGTMHCCCCSGLQFGVYELVKGLWIQQRGLSPTALIGDIANLVMGLISGCVTQSLTCPIKTIAIRIGAGVAGEKSMGEAASNIFKEGGIGGFLCARHFFLCLRLAVRSLCQSVLTLCVSCAVAVLSARVRTSAGNMTGLISQPVRNTMNVFARIWVHNANDYQDRLRTAQGNSVEPFPRRGRSPSPSTSSSGSVTSVRTHTDRTTPAELLA
jgi:hypothetical protein